MKKLFIAVAVIFAFSLTCANAQHYGPWSLWHIFYGADPLGTRTIEKTISPAGGALTINFTSQHTESDLIWMMEGAFSESPIWEWLENRYDLRVTGGVRINNKSYTTGTFTIYIKPVTSSQPRTSWIDFEVNSIYLTQLGDGD